MDNISVELLTELKAIDASLQKVIFYNALKGRYTIQILWKNSECILKWNEKGFIEYLGKLKKEIGFYEKMQQKDVPYIPKVLHVSDNYFIQEKLNGDSTRNVLVYENRVKDKSIRAVLDEIRDAVEWMYLENELFISENKYIDTQKELKSYIGKMLKSGPMNTKNSYLMDKVLGVLSVLTMKSIDRLDNSCLQNGLIIHGDLHLNNFYSTDDGRVCILDWENTKIGSRYLELAYLYAQVNYLLIDNDNERLYWKSIMSNGIQKLSLSAKVFRYYAEIFSNIIECNPRYGYNVNKMQIAKSHLKLVKLMIEGYFRKEN